MLKMLAALLIAGLGTAAEAKPVVIELFTSQGCSSCPPADKVLARLSQQKDVIAISWPVTYWDQLGWKDTLARPSNTKRQYAYATALHQDGVYTPQAVIDGVTHTIGSGAADIAREISQREGKPAAVTVSLALTATNQVQIKTSAAADSYDVRLVTLKASETVAVGRGENSRRALTYTNIAMADSVVASGTAAQNLLVAAPAADRVAVLVESKKTHAILGAALLALR